MDDAFRMAGTDAPPRSGGTRAIIEASRERRAATLAVVIDISGSTYALRRTIALFGPADAQVGWLSGGCLEPEIARRAARAADASRIEWIEIDTRDDEDLFSGSAVGCRGRLRIVLLPIGALAGWSELADAWLARRAALDLCVTPQGVVEARVADTAASWQLASDTPAWSTQAAEWRVSLAPPPLAVVFGAGPETALLVPMLRALGWLTAVVERRARWLAAAHVADRELQLAAAEALAALAGRVDAALVMHHNFELDREALAALAAHDVPFIGLLGPKRRREDLFSVLPPALRDALSPRLHSPIGLRLGGDGPEAIALSIAAQLQTWRHSV